MNNYDKINNILSLILTFLIIIIYINLPVVSNFILNIYIYIYLIFGILMLLLTIAKKKFKVKTNDIVYFVTIFFLTIIGSVVNKISMGNLIIINCTYIYIYIYLKIPLYLIKQKKLYSYF